MFAIITIIIIICYHYYLDHGKYIIDDDDNEMLLWQFIVYYTRSLVNADRRCCLISDSVSLGLQGTHYIVQLTRTEWSAVDTRRNWIVWIHSRWIWQSISVPCSTLWSKETLLWVWLCRWNGSRTVQAVLPSSRLTNMTMTMWETSVTSAPAHRLHRPSLSMFCDVCFF